MKYTKNIANKLLNEGFKFDYNHTDDEINYDVFKTPHLEVTVDHTNKEVVVNITMDDESVNIHSIEQLIALKKMITNITQQ